MKNNRAIKVLFVAVLVPCAALLRCGANPNSGGTETGDSKIASMLFNPGGSPAVSAKVCFRHHDNDPRPGHDSGVVDSTYTDANGNFTITLDPGTYTIEASGDSGLAFQDSITAIKGDTVHLHPDTLKPAGTIRGVVQLQPGDDPRTVFILFMGTRTFTWPDDSLGNFTSGTMAGSRYRVRILTTTPNYDMMDTSFTITAGVDAALPDTLRLHYTGIPVPTGLRIVYDTLKQIVTLIWNKPVNGRAVQSYTIYRKRSDSATFVNIKGGVTDTTYSDSTGVQDQMYEYRVAVVDTQNTTGVMSAGVNAEIMGIFFVSDSIVKGGAVGVDGNFGQFGRGVLDSTGNFYITDNTNKWLQKLDSTGNFIFKITTLSVPIAITNYKDSALYACDYDRREILKASLQGSVDTVFPTIGRPGGVCTRGDTVFISSDSGIEIYNLIGTRLDLLSYAFKVALSQPDITAETNGNLYVVEDRGLFEINLQSRLIRNILTFNSQYDNQQARIAIYNGDTLVIIAQRLNPNVGSNLYLVGTDGNLIGRWYTSSRMILSGITIDKRKGTVCFSDGRIFFLQR